MIISPFFLKTICFFLFFLVGAKASAQHCPYDGMYMIVVHVPEQVTQPGGTTLLRLTEVDNNEAGNCDAARGLLQKKVFTCKQFAARLAEPVAQQGRG